MRDVKNLLCLPRGGRCVFGRSPVKTLPPGRKKTCRARLNGAVIARQRLDAQMRLKTVFDPDWLLNPAKVFPLAGRPVVGGAE